MATNYTYATNLGERCGSTHEGRQCEGGRAHFGKHADGFQTRPIRSGIAWDTEGPPNAYLEGKPAFCYADWAQKQPTLIAGRFLDDLRGLNVDV